MEPIPVPDTAKATRPSYRLVSMGPPRGVSDEVCGTVEMLIEPTAGYPGVGRAQYAYYRPSPVECAQLARGGFLEMAQYGDVVQPFSLVVWPPPQPETPDGASQAAHGPYSADADPPVQAERNRQIDEKGYTPAHDDAHTLRELAACADERLARLIAATGTFQTVEAREATQDLIEIRAVMLALVESAERRLAERPQGVPQAPGVVGDYECVKNVRVVDLRPGDVVRDFMDALGSIFVVATPHPVYPTLQLVVWRLADGTWSHDALDARQVVGNRDDIDEHERARRLRASFGQWNGAPW